MLEAFQSSNRSGLWASLAAKLNSFAKESRLVQRVSKHFSPEGFLLAMLEATSTGRASLTQLVATMGWQAPCLSTSPQALHGRINRTECGVEGFLVRCLSHLCRHRLGTPEPAEGKCPFGRIIVEDSTSLRLPKGNAEEFPAHGNASGETAGCKVDLAFDLLGGAVVHNELHTATEQDKTIGVGLLDDVRRNDLVLRDMGYFGVRNFSAIEKLGAFWLSRLPLNVDVLTPAGVPLEKVLAKCGGDTLDLAVTLTAKGHAARLVAVRASQQEADKRRRERRREAKRKGRAAGKKALLRDGWHLMVTNVPEEMQPVAIYSQRWLIEMAFRAWKQAGNMAKALNRASSPQHLKGLVLAGMIAMVIGLKFGLALARAKPQMRYSLEKIFDYIIARLVALRKLTELAEIKPDPRHLQGQKRKRMSLNCRLIELLS